MTCQVEKLGVVDYAEGLHLQGERVAARKAGVITDTLLLLEHPHVYTLGRNAKTENLLISAEQLAARGAQVDRKSTRLNSSHCTVSRMPSSA